MRIANGWANRNHFLNEGATFLENAAFNTGMNIFHNAGLLK